MKRAAFLLALAFVWTSPSMGQAPPGADAAKDEKELAAAFLQIAEQEAAAYEIRFERADGDPFELQKQPVLRWSNPVVGTIHGGVFLWTSKGRPEAVASIYKWYSPFQHMTTELQSLSTSPLVVEKSGQEIWHPDRGGVEFRTLPGAEAPGGSAAIRLRQIRTLGRDFAASKTERNGAVQQLRLLPQPIYRYQTSRADLLDGALLAFVEGTDPELFLLLEARSTGSRSEWQFALARMNSIALSATFRGKGIWSADELPWGRTQIRTEPYTTFLKKPEPKAPSN